MSTFTWGVILVAAGALAAIIYHDAFKEFVEAGFGELDLGPASDFDDWERQFAAVYDWAAE